jgi:tetratricopeptide (TPR) repeat protein
LILNGGGETPAMRGKRLLTQAAVVIFLAAVPELVPADPGGRARAWEQKVVIPTYAVGPAEANPIFYNGRAYQGARGPIYPYPLLDRLSDRKENKAYRALYLENPYIRICVLPEIGGRIFEAVDKTNGYDFVYRQHVIKPALIGMLGAWISGGVEWNIPHHHRATTFMTVDSSIENGADGSATIWVGEIELRHRTKWIVGLTLRPDSSAVEVTIRIFNRTPLAYSILCFANVAVHANDAYQILFPPATEVATFHGKNQFSGWPISHEVYNGQDYTRGVDVSWWKNHLTPTSFFAFDAEEDFLGGYDHGKKAGVAFIGDHNIVPGKKLWTWGTGSEGKTWERILTDVDGPYLELMIGSYSDNQPDYSWTQPYETKTSQQFWYPIRGLGGLKNANREAACNLDVSDGRARIAFNSTSDRKAARGVLKSGDTVVFEDTFDIGPGTPYVKDADLHAGADALALRLALYDANGRELVHYAPYAKKNKPLPAPVVPPPPPKDVKTNEELYLAGLRLEQFYNPALEPYPYYEEALRRDSGDVRANMALGILYLKRGMYHEAEERLRTALVRLTSNYTRPKDVEVYYYLGLALRSQGKTAEAEDAFQRAAWSSAWYGPSFYQLAELASTSGDFGRALEYLDRTLSANSLNLKALSLKAALLRRQGRRSEAIAVAEFARRTDPLDPWSLHELSLAQGAEGETGGTGENSRTVLAVMGDSVTNVLELAMDYGNCGLWKEAVATLEPRVVSGKAGKNPLANYAFAYFLDRLKQGRDFQKYLQAAATLPYDYVFPFELEFMDVLTWAMKESPHDARAPYYLGNLLFDLRPDKAIEVWEKSRSLDPSLAVVHRNLGLAYARVKNDLPAAVASLEKAVAADRKDPRLYYERDVLYEAAGEDPMKRLAHLAQNRDIVALSDNALGREIGLLIQTGRFDRALELLRGHHFHVWEGGGEIYGLWVEANLLRGRKYLDMKKYPETLKDFEAAQTYPANLEVAPPSRGAGSAKIFYLIAAALEHLGKKDEAAPNYVRAAGLETGWSEQSYFKALALVRLGKETEAAGIFEGLFKYAGEKLGSSLSMDFFEKFGEKQSAKAHEAQSHLLAGLGLRGMKREREAVDELKRALALEPNMPEARRQLTEMGEKR